MVERVDEFASRFIGIREIPGKESHPFISWCLSLCTICEVDEIPWCGAFIRGLAELLDLKYPVLPARARSWLTAGDPVKIKDARAGDIVISKRGTGVQPGPEVLNAPGHVCIFTTWSHKGYPMDKPLKFFYGIGGNQKDSICEIEMSTSNILGVRRLK